MHAANPPVRRFTRHPVVAPAAAGGVLSAREREVLGLMAAGYSNPEIAATLVLGAATIETHVRAIYVKLGLGAACDSSGSRRVQAVLRYLELYGPPPLVVR